MRSKVIFELNGQREEVGAEHAGWMLADYLRVVKGLTGTKIVCAEGDCGACSVLRLLPAEGSGVYRAVNSCIALVAQMDGSSLVTVDALMTEKGMTPVQGAMAAGHGSQCGFCTPGFVVALTALVEKRVSKGTCAGRLSVSESKNALTGNLCRCTGYQHIIDAATTIDLGACESVKQRFSNPEKIQDLRAATAKPVLIKGENFVFFAPKTLKEAVRYLGAHKDARVLGAATDLAVVHNKGKARLQNVLSLHLIDDLHGIRVEKDGRLRVGASVTLADLREVLKTKVPHCADYLNLFASPQIKNVATLVGNVANASPIADTPPFLLVTDAKLEIFGSRGRRTLALEDFYLGYRKTALKPGELISAITFTPPAKEESFALVKISERKDLDISAVNAGFRLRWADRAASKIAEVSLALGGVGPIPMRLRRTEALLNGRELTDRLKREALEMLQTEISPIDDVRGSSAYRRVVAESLLRRFLNGETYEPAP